MKTYPVSLDLVNVDLLCENTSIVFHAMNKSGSESLSNLMYEAFNLNGRGFEFFSHFRLPISQIEFVRLVESNKNRGFYIDHYLYGALKPKPNRVLLTQFRHPIPRILSAYNWLKNISKRENPTIVFPDFKSFVVDTAGVSHSIVAQLGLSWSKYGDSDLNWLKKIGTLSAKELYERSVESIDREIYAIGIAEYFEESIFLYATLCGLKSVPAWVRDKRNEDRILSSELTEDMVSIIKDIFSYDFMLYEFALKRFWSQFENLESNLLLLNYKNACAHQYRDRVLIDLP